MIERNRIRWVGLKYLQLARDIVSPRTGRIELSGAALKVLDVFYRLAASSFRRKPHDRYCNMPEILVASRIGIKAIVRYTGLTDRVIIKAIQELTRAKRIEVTRGGQRRSGRGRRCNAYSVLRGDQIPVGGLFNGLVQHGTWQGQAWRQTFGWDRTLLGSNNVRYFTAPEHFVTHVLPLLSAAETKLYHAILWTANEQGSVEVDITRQTLQKTSGIKSYPAFQKALDGLDAFGLIQCADDRRIILCDPETRLPLNVTCIPSEDNHRNWKTEAGRRLDPFDVLRERPEWLLRHLLGADASISRGAGHEFRFRCPFHDDKKPSASINAVKGAWYCHGNSHERNRGNIWQLIQWTQNISNALDVKRYLADLLGVPLSYAVPRTSYERFMEEARPYYDYFSKAGKLTFRKLRVEGEDGKKRFPLYRPKVGGGFTSSDQWELPRLLYRWPTAKTNVVIICEGEKDVETLERLRLVDRSGSPVLVTTTGGSSSWANDLAEEFVGKLVIVMPDADEPGRRYADNVTSALAWSRIEHFQITFGDDGVKDVSEFLQTYDSAAEELVRRMGGHVLLQTADMVA